MLRGEIMTVKTKVFNIVHIAACAASLCVMWLYLSKFKEHLPNGIWDQGAMPAAAVIIAGMIGVTLHLTHHLVKMTTKTKD